MFWNLNKKTNDNDNIIQNSKLTSEWAMGILNITTE